MKQLIILSVTFTLLGWGSVVAGNPLPKPVEVGINIKIKSQALQQVREIQIYLPDGYVESDKQYPVLYLLDGQRWFLQGVSLVKNFREYDYIPEMIIIGVDTNDEGRRGFFNQSKQLAQFLNQEVVGFVDEHYRTSNAKLLFGWQFAGSFALSQSVSTDNKFNGFIVASPFPVSGQRIEQIKQGATRLKSIEQFLFFASHPKEASVADGTDELNLFLAELASSKLRWQYLQLNSMVASSVAHRYSPIDTLFNGLLAYFEDYSNLEFDSISDFLNFGGVTAVEKFYKNKGEKYGGANQISQEGMFNLVRLAMRSDNLPVFDELLEHFTKYQFLDNTNLSWASSYADFYLKNNKFEKAITIYQLLTHRFPKSPRPQYGLGKVFESQQQPQKAIEHYQIAVDIAKNVADANLETYQRALANINHHH